MDIGNLNFRSIDFDDYITIRDYLKTLLLEVWFQEEGFNGKRPFGNSGWKYDIYICLIKNKIVKGTLDEDGYIEEFKDHKKADKIIANYIRKIFKEEE